MRAIFSLYLTGEMICSLLACGRAFTTEHVHVSLTMS